MLCILGTRGPSKHGLRQARTDLTAVMTSVQVVVGPSGKDPGRAKKSSLKNNRLSIRKCFGGGMASVKCKGAIDKKDRVIFIEHNVRTGVEVLSCVGKKAL